MFLSWELLTGLGVGFYKGQYPGAVLFLVSGVQIGIVGLAGLYHLPKDFQEPLSQTTQGASVAFALGTLLPVVDLGPGTSFEATTGPEMDGVAQDLVALVADSDAVDLAGLKTDGSRSSDTLQCLGVLEAIDRAADFPQEAWCQGLSGTG